MQHIVVGTAGHIDHGKSALVRALTGEDPDRLKEEKARGITIDLGFAHYRRGGVNVAFVDVPGHERFVRNMLAGASGFDGVMLVVAADESVMPQTREHFEICRLLGVRHGLVAITKTDLVDEETVELVKLETAELVEDSFLEGATMVPVSAKTGSGLDTLKAVLEGLADGPAPSRSGGVARLPVDRTFTVKGFGTVVTGTQVSGRIRAETELVVLPSGRPVKVRGLQVHGAGARASGRGQRVAVNLSGIEVDDLRRGDALVSPGGLEVTRRVDGTLTLLGEARPLKHGARVRFHAGTSEVMARVSLAPGPAAGERVISALDPGGTAYARLRLEREVALTRGDRFVLRAYSPPITIAGGRVLDPAPPRGRFRSPAGRARLVRFDRWDDPWDAVETAVDEAGARGLDRERLTPRLGLAPQDLDEGIAGLERRGRVRAVGDTLVPGTVYDTLQARVVGWVADYHDAHPQEPGLSREEARERFGREANPALFDPLIAGLVEAGTLRARDRLALASHEIAFSDEERRLRERIVDALAAAGLTPPDGSGLATAAGDTAEAVERMVKLLVREGALVRVESLVFHRDALEQVKREVAALARPEERVEVDVAGFKRRYGITRKYAIPLLAYLDRERVTRRVGDVRIVLS